MNLPGTVTIRTASYVDACDLSVDPLYPVHESDELLPNVDVSRVRGSRSRKATHNDVC